MNRTQLLIIFTLMGPLQLSALASPTPEDSDFYAAQVDAYLNPILDKIKKAAADLGYDQARTEKIKIIQMLEKNGEYLNAEMTENGELYLSVEYLNHISSEDEAAMILSHECAHWILRHYDRLKDLDENAKLKQVYKISKVLETEADALGVRLMAEAGYNAFDSVQLMKDIRTIHKDYLSVKDQLKLIFKPHSHPVLFKRAKNLRKTIRLYGLASEREVKRTAIPAAVLESIDNIVYDVR